MPEITDKNMNLLLENTIEAEGIHAFIRYVFAHLEEELSNETASELKMSLFYGISLNMQQLSDRLEIIRNILDPS